MSEMVDIALELNKTNIKPMLGPQSKAVYHLNLGFFVRKGASHDR